MSSQNQVTPRDLLEEAKKRVLFLVICIVGLSYMMSLTSSSVWVNLPAAAFFIILVRYFSLDLEMRRKAATYIRRPLPEHAISQEKPLECPKVINKSEWRRKVNSRVAEDAIDHFSRHLISEWVTDLWYSRLTPDKEGPEELINIVNGVLGEIAGRFRNINLIDLLMRDLINLICTHLENFRSTKLKIEKRQLGNITIEKLDTELRQHLAMENRLHPALFSSEAQHKVLQHVMDGLILYTFRHEDLQCLYFRYTARELLASAVMRPVLNLASPRFINERIESLVINMKKPKTVESMHENLGSKPDGSSSIPSDDLSKFLDPSMAGVELVQMKNAQSTTPTNLPTKFNSNASFSKDPLLSIDTRSSRSWNSEPPTSQNVHESTIQKHNSGEWGEKLDQFSRRKVKALAPEHFENMWAKGRNYKMKENENQLNKNAQHGPPQGKPLSISVKREKKISKTIDIENEGKLNSSKNTTVHLGCSDPLTVNGSSCRTDSDILNDSTEMHYQDNDRDVMHLNDLDSDGNTSEDEETSNVTGLDSPVTKVWNARNNRNVGISHIHHPLESSDGCRVKKAVKGKDHNNRLSRNQSGRKRSRHNSEQLPVWQEVERTSFISGDGQDILNSPLGPANDDDSSDDSDMESSGRIHSGAAASSSVLSISQILPSDYSQSSQMVDSFFRLKCEVMGANIVKSGSRTFAVYSISVTDVNSNHSWSIKRRFSHFEELHRRLKEFSEYNLHLPPKHFLSTGLDFPVIQERSVSSVEPSAAYYARLIQLPRISGSIEVWDFLSVDSQTYIFLDSFSIIETLSVDPSDKSHEEYNRSVSNPNSPLSGLLPLRRDHAIAECLEPKLQAKTKLQPNGLRLNSKGTNPGRTENQKENGTLSDKNSGKTESQNENEKSGEASDLLLDAATDPMLPTEWVPPNLTVPIFDLVDVIFQLQDGGWIRRKAFWVAKQVLQLGMGDALEDWLIQKIQRFRKGSSMASAINRLEQILWPGGVFITKRPKQPPSLEGSTSGNNSNEILSPQSLEELQQQEADRRAKFVYDLMITNAPPAIVGLVGRKEYEQCAKDLYYFLQSAVCTKLLALDLIELLLLTLFPELDSVFKQLHERKEKFGELDAHI
ncbi:PX domain-containing protein/PXA domain-containing protein/Nexin_C domain-containing protein [Cucumis melo var. makuwa]|uniref:PX domain-containing protein/PXA domain-containing protein/Nexin_C domain-containing protein n=1 Tax=Cucumis melo var. makuwa TaxID=1194695 RepID=A0A5D3BWZ3_CUCMM|nr:PX domain-containing protein/PXA domain-containing protein/Nexin_C domain-containing protein [Cucumis melo var. makuwa]